jgi:hypothetical protein
LAASQENFMTPFEFAHSDLSKNLLVFASDGQVIEAHASRAQLRGLLHALVLHFAGDLQSLVPPVDRSGG